MDPNDPEIVDVDLEPSEEILEDEGEHDSGNEAETKFVPIFIHLGGRFIQGAGNSISYVDGECDDWIINRDKFTLFELYTKIGIARYDADMVDQIWYLEPRKTITDGLKPIRNDHDIRDVLGVLKVEKKVHIYVSHVPNFAEIIPILPLPAPSDKGMVADNLVEVEGRVENDHVDVEGRVEDASHAVDVEGRVEDASHAVDVEGRVEDAGHAVEVEGRVEDVGNDGNEDNEHSEDEDDFLPYISELSDNEDEETVEARKKMKSLHEATSRSKNARKGVKYGRNQPSTRTSHEIPSSSTGHNDLGLEDSLSSDEDISYISTSEEDGSEVEHARRRKSKHKVFRGTDDGNVQIELGMVFLNKAEFKKAVDKLSIMQMRQIKWVKNDKKRHRAICNERHCDWKILLAWDKPTETWMVKTFNSKAICNERHCDWKILLAWDKPTETWMVKTFNSEHTCEWGLTNRRCNSTFAMNHLLKTKGFTAVYLKSDDIFTEIWDELNVELTQVQCRIIKRRLRKTFEGDHSLEYNKLFDYAAELRKRDPGATVSIYAPRPLPELNPIFLRMYVCFSAMKKGFIAGCRRVIGLDGAFLKGPHKGELLTAVGRDANDQMYPIAWGIVEVEKEESWLWFLEELKYDLQIGDGDCYAIISNQQKGLINVVAALFPNAEHKHCARHRYANFKKKHKGKELQALFWRCVKALNEAEFNAALTELGKLKPATRDDIMNVDPKH
ncbi:hypothetical protein SLEP1_g58509 [Rubroshorea leprosula]|uniref:Transposase n=1 Tax=Rubroshorea leprosula TaxID=152421 RepID=A0AAV5MPI7_9ROSI|nr:hypothetical protein SLEP1_g58509 [Rubroshorea leprosula]